jgi:hypothetical protein
MTLRLRTAWLEVAAGFHLLFAAVATHDLANGVDLFGLRASRGYGVTVMLLAACAVFLLHPLQTMRTVRRGLFLFAGSAAAAGAAWLLTSGRFEVAVPQIGFAAWLLGAAFLPALDRRISATDEVRAHGLNVIAGAALAVLGVHVFITGGSALWYAPFMSMAALAAGAAMVWVELRLAARFRLAVTLLGAAVFLYHGVAALAAADIGTGGVMLAIFAVLLFSVTTDRRLPAPAD